MNEKEFEKQQLEQLLNDLKDIDKYTSFKNGAFIYDLGKYQGSLLVNYINNLQSKVDKANEILNRPQFEKDNIPCNCEEDIKELKDVLKEVENVENN